MKDVVYAKNPAPEDVDQVVDTPAELVVQNPTTSNKKMGKSKRKRDSKGRFMSKSRKNAADDFVDTGKSLFMEYGLAALAATGTVKGAQYLINKAPVNIPGWAREWLMIVGPGAAGIGLSMWADKKSPIWQGVAGGMVLASANGLSDKLIEGVAPGGMSDAMVGENDLILKPDGYLYDRAGNRVAKANIDEGKLSTALPAADQNEAFAMGTSNLLQDADFSQTFEGGEDWAP